MKDSIYYWSPELEFGTIIPELVLVRGLPGSGKTTLAKYFEKKYNFIHMETDMYFINKESGLYEYNKDKISDAHDWCFDTTKNLLNDKSKVVVSNTFTKFNEIERYLELTKKYLILCCLNNFGSTHNVPTEIIQKMKDRFEMINGEIYYEL